MNHFSRVSVFLVIAFFFFFNRTWLSDYFELRKENVKDLFMMVSPVL